MVGNDRVRHCFECKLDVYNFSAMTSEEIERIVAQRQGRLCARFYERPDGTMLTTNCPVGFRAVIWRASRVASAALAAILSVRPAMAQSAGAQNNAPLVQIDQPQRGLMLKVVDLTGAVVAGAAVTIKGGPEDAELLTKTDNSGEINIVDLPSGDYEVTVVFPGFKTLKREHLSVPMRQILTLQLGLAVNMGVVVTVAAEIETGSTPTDSVLSEPSTSRAEGAQNPRQHHNALSRFFSKIRHSI
jgi:Carboxypeptidase regulatory-like domain